MAQERGLPSGAARRTTDAERIARAVFRPNPNGSERAGLFLLTPDGRLRLLAVTPDKLKTGDFRQEAFRLAVHVRQRQARERRAEMLARRQRLEAELRDPSRPKPLSGFFGDASLVPGDVVVTSDGLQVFRGSPDFPYTAGHFVPLARWRQDGGTQQRLEAIERELKRKR